MVFPYSQQRARGSIYTILTLQGKSMGNVCNSQWENFFGNIYRHVNTDWGDSFLDLCIAGTWPGIRKVKSWFSRVRVVYGILFCVCGFSFDELSVRVRKFSYVYFVVVFYVVVIFNELYAETRICMYRYRI